MSRNSWRILLLFFFAFGSSGLYAQIIRGTIKDKTNLALPGVSVIVKGTTIGTATDASGKFALEVNGGKVLELTMIGFQDQELTIQDAATEINAVMLEDAQQLEEVVVTALGIKRERKALGYAVQELKGDAILESREANVANALSGKISGLQVIRSSNGPGGSSKITLRGNNSLTGNNQPLIVIDGVPMNNFTGGVDDVWGNSKDMGSGIGDINPDDIESMSVLKGGSAAALYGTRAGNGVILITTKSGQKQEGVGITVSAGLNLQTIFKNPHLQNEYAQGSLGGFDRLGSSSWGPKATGQMEEQWDGVKGPVQIYDNIDNFFNTGVTTTENISFQQNIKETSIYASINRMDDKSMIPNAKLNRTSLTARISTSLGESKKWKLDVKANYINNIAHNRPIQGINQSNAFNTIYMLPRSLDVMQFKNSLDADGKSIWYNRATTSQENPWWVTEYVQNKDKRDRLIGTFGLRYLFTDWLNLEVKAGTDYYTTLITNKRYAGGVSSPNGTYSEKSETFFENNYSFLLAAQKDNIVSKFGGSATFGGNIMHQEFKSLSADAGQLFIPDLFNINNGKDPTSVEYKYTPQKINSLYGSFQANWDGYLFLDLTLRSDWSSTMSKQNRNFSYPSVSFSWVVSDMLTKLGGELPMNLTFAKLRASYAEVGNALEPFQLYNTYTTEKDVNGNITASANKILFNENLKNEIITSKEIGGEFRFFRNRLGLDVAWYRSNAKNQLLNIPMDPATTGYSSKKINAGNIQNEGWEFMINGRIFDNPNGFSWEANLNLSTNRNKILYLDSENPSYEIKAFDEVKVMAITGSDYGDIYGRKYQRVTDAKSPHFGKVIVSESGLPRLTPDNYCVGNQQAKWLAGLTNSFRYKGFNLSFLIDGRFGGEIYSGTTSLLYKTGSAKGTVINSERPDFVIPNSVVERDGSFVENTIPVGMEKYYTEGIAPGNIGIAEAFVYDATNIRLRNVTLGYQFNRKMLTKTPFQRINVSLSCNNVWMIYYDLPGIDPESVVATNTNATGFELGAAPTMRTFSFNLTFGF